MWYWHAFPLPNNISDWVGIETTSNLELLLDVFSIISCVLIQPWWRSRFISPDSVNGNTSIGIPNLDIDSSNSDWLPKKYRKFKMSSQSRSRDRKISSSKYYTQTRICKKTAKFHTYRNVILFVYDFVWAWNIYVQIERSIWISHHCSNKNGIQFVVLVMLLSYAIMCTEPLVVHQ